jgi:hypothetical protein
MRYVLGVLIVLGCVTLLVGLADKARGPKHHRGNEIGSHGTPVVVVVNRGGT